MLNTTTEELLRLPQVLEIVPVSRATWYLRVKKGHFPKPVKIGARAAAWRRRDIEKLAAKFTKSWDENEKWVDDENFDPVKGQS